MKNPPVTAPVLAAAALLGPTSVPRGSFHSLGHPEARTWAPSRRLRNRAVHALHGNGPRDRGWEAGGRRGGDLHWLQQPQTVGALRAAGWVLPSTVPDEHLLRVYDTRLQPDWLRGLVIEAGGLSDAIRIIGGDVLTTPDLDDAQALAVDVRPWGRERDGACHLVVPPRPHLEEWARRISLQMPIENAGTICTLCVVVDRARVAGGLEVARLKQQIPQIAVLLEDKALDKDVVLIGERAHSVKVPATTDDRRLPPVAWEESRLPVNRALVLVNVRRAGGAAGRVLVRGLRGTLPAPPSSELEVLRLEFRLPPATRQRDAERAVRLALRKVAGIMQLPEPPPHNLRQVEVVNGGLLANLGVPRGQALAWLAGSGCGGLYLRPFWNAGTGEAVKRENFVLLWSRGGAERGPALWDTFHGKKGVVGLYLQGRDVALRVTKDAHVPELQAQLRHMMNDTGASFRMATPGSRWWRLAPLTEAETWRVRDMITQLGLAPLHGQVRLAGAGPFRRAAYFAAVGSPSRMTLDDGSWTSSSAQLSPCQPPPQAPRPSAGARRGPAAPGPALAPGSTWGGARAQQTPVAPSTPGAPVRSPTALPSGSSRGPQPKPKPSPRPRAQPAPQPKGLSKPSATANPGGSSAARSGTSASLVAATTAGDTGLVARLLERVDQLLAEIQQLRRDMGHMERENYKLRQQVELARGLQQHEPYLRLTGELPGADDGPPDGEGLPASGGVGMVRPRSPPLPPTLTSEGEVGSSPAKLSSPDAKRLRDSTAVRMGVDADSTAGSLAGAGEHGF